MARKKKRGSVVYAIALMLYVLVLIVAVSFGLTKVWTYAEEYEAARPELAIDAYIDNLSRNLWDDSIAETIAAMPHEVQSDEECKEIVKNMLSDELSYVRLPGNVETSDKIAYNLLCGGNVFGKVTISQDKSKERDTEFGMLPWVVTDEEFDFNGLYSSMRITVPATYSVKLNDVTLGEEYIVERDIHYDILEDYYEQYKGLPTKVTYEFNNIIGHLEPVVYGEDGEVFVIDPAKDDSQFIGPCDGAVLARLEEYAAGFSETYLAYSSGVYDPMYAYSKLQPYITLGGDLDYRLKQAMDGYGWAHTTSYRLDSAVLNSAIDIGDGFYIIDITAVTTTTYPNKGDNGVVTSENGMRLIVQDTAGEIRAITVERYMSSDS